MSVTDPPGGMGLSKGDVLAGARLIEPMARGERITVWRAERSEGEAATVHVLTGAVHPREKDNFLKGARKLSVLTRSGPLRGLVDIVTVIPKVPAYVARGGTAGTMEDVTILGWGVRDTVRFIRRVCRALGVLHESGVAHGCLRPANVLLDDDLNPRLSDAGALIIDDSYDGPSDMKHDYASYAAREVRLGKKPDVRSDIFSVGRLLYFGLHGEEPAEKDEDTPLLSVLEHAPAGLVRIIRRCTLRAPEGRYGSVQQVIKDLENWRDPNDVGIRHPQGKEGAQEDSGSPTDSDPPSYPERPSLRPSDSDRKSERKSERKSARDAGPSTGERQAPSLTIRSYHAPVVEEGDVLTASQVRLGAALGVVVMGASLLSAYFGGIASDVAIAGVVAGGVAFSLAFPPMLSSPLVSRMGMALMLGTTLWYIDLATELAVRGRTSLLQNGGIAQRGQVLARLRAKGIRKFERLDFRGVSFSGLNISHVSLAECQLVGAQFVGTTLQRVDLEDADVAQADFSGADLTGTAVSNTKGWRDAICSETTTMPHGWECDGGEPFPIMQRAPEPALEPTE